MEEGDFVIIPPEVSQAVFSAEEGAVTVNIIIKRSTFGEAFYSLLMENDDISDFFWQMLYSKGTNGRCWCAADGTKGCRSWCGKCARRGFWTGREAGPGKT